MARRLHQGEHAQGEGRVRAHGNAPTPSGRLASVEGEVDERGQDHSADGRDDRHGDPLALAELAHVQLAANLEPDDKEEERHQAIVDPVPQVEHEFVAPEPQRGFGVPQALVRA